MDIISYDNLDIILSYLYVSEYKYIDKYLYLKANENASNIIKKYVRRYKKESAFIENKVYNMINLNRNETRLEYNLILKYINLHVRKSWCITKRNMETVDKIVNNAKSKFFEYIDNIIEINNVNILHEFGRNYILNSELAETEAKLIDLSNYILKHNKKYFKKIQLKFIIIFYKNFLNISKSILYLENKIKKIVEESTHKYPTQFKQFMYKFVIYYIIKKTLNKMTIIYKHKLYEIYENEGFNNLVDSVEIDPYDYFYMQN